MARQSHTSTSWCVPRANRFGELLIEFAPRSTESDRSYWVPVLVDLLYEQPEQIPGQWEIKTPLPFSEPF